MSGICPYFVGLQQWRAWEEVYLFPLCWALATHSSVVEAFLGLIHWWSPTRMFSLTTLWGFLLLNQRAFWMVLSFLLFLYFPFWGFFFCSFIKVSSTLSSTPSSWGFFFSFLRLYFKFPRTLLVCFLDVSLYVSSPYGLHYLLQFLWYYWKLGWCVLFSTACFLQIPLKKYLRALHFMIHAFLRCQVSFGCLWKAD